MDFKTRFAGRFMKVTKKGTKHTLFTESPEKFNTIDVPSSCPESPLRTHYLSLGSCKAERTPASMSRLKTLPSTSRGYSLVYG